MSKITKILKVVGVGALLVGASLLAGCGVPKEQYNAQTQALVSAQEEIAVKKSQIDALSNDKLLANLEITDLNNAIADQNSKINELQEQIVNEAVTEVIAENAFIFDKLAINQEFTETFSDKEINILDTKIVFDDEEYDVEEFVSLTATPSSNGDDFAENVFLIVEEEGLSYVVNLDGNLNTNLINEDTPLELKFLGEDTKIIDWNIDSVTFSKGIEYSANEGELVGGVEVKMVGPGYAVIKVGSESKKIFEGNSYKFGNLDVKVTDVLYQDYAGGVHAVDFEVGDDVEFTVEDGEEYTDDSIYEYRITYNSIGLTLVEPFVSIDTDEDYKALTLGESIKFPKYLEIEYAGLTSEDISKVSFEPVQKNGNDYIKVKGLFTSGMEDFDKVYVNASGIYDEDLTLLGTTVDIDNTEQTLTLTGGNLQVNNIVMPLNLSNITVNGIDISGTDNKFRTNYGIIISNPEDSIDNEKIVLEIPEEQLTANVKIKTN